MNLLSLPLPRPKALPPVAAAMPAALATPQARPSWWDSVSASGNPFSYIPEGQDLLLYEQLVQAIPLINAALTKTVELIGVAEFEHPDDAVEAELKEWLKTVRVNHLQRGFCNWQNTWVLDHLTYGRSHAEIIPTRDMTEIGAIQELHPRTIALKPKPTVYDVDMVQWQTGQGEQVLLNPRTIVTALYDVRTDNPYGSSLCYGLPFVAETLRDVIWNLGQTWKRWGTPAYHGNVELPETFNDPNGVISEGIRSSFTSQLRDVQKRRLNNDIADLVTTGKVTLGVMGATDEVLEFTDTVRTLCEQIVAKLNLPPMMLGLQWQAGERIGTTQAKLLSARIDAIREALASGLLYVVQLRQALTGRPTDVTLCWEAPTLVDALEQAQADFAEAQAEEKDIANDKALWKLNVIGPQEFARRHREDLAGLSNEEVVAALAEEGLTMDDQPPEEAPPQPLGGGFGGNGNGQQQMPQRSLTYANGRH